MRFITRQVIYEKVFYIAEDGTEFTRERDCEAYERRKREEKLSFYTPEFEKTGLEDLYVCKG